MDSPNSQQAPTPAHSDLLRDEVLVMRGLFGYWHEEIVQTPSLSQGLPADLGNTLPGLALCHVLLVSLDADTKGSSIGDSKYIRKATKKFLFGKVEPIQCVDLKSRFEGLIAGRQMVLVFYGESVSDWKFFQSLHLQLGQQPLAVLDTVKASQCPLRLSYRWSLEKLLETIGTPFEALHAAGNDAHFCLRTLLKIAVKDAENRPKGTGGTVDDGWVRTLTHIARFPLPTLSEPEPTADEIWLKERQKEKQEATERRRVQRAEKIERRKQEREARAAGLFADTKTELGPGQGAILESDVGRD